MIFIHGMGHFHPENIIDNAFLESLDIGTDDQWIIERVGIRRRRTVLSLDYIRETKNADPTKAAANSLYTNAQTGARAAMMALERAGLGPKDIGLVVAGGCSPQHLIPAEACLIANELGISCNAFDLNAACSSFAVQLHYLNAMHPDALPDYILVVNAENNTRTVDYRDRRTAVLWGDASTATVVSTRKPSPMKVVQTTVESDPSGWEKVRIPAGGHFAQDGAAVQRFAITKTVHTFHRLMELSGIDRSKVQFIGHQANLTMLTSARERANLLPNQHLYNIDEYGNCGAAGAPSVLSQHWGRWKPGSDIALVVVGSGLTWGGLLLRAGQPPQR
jgi:3-oxoacyl-[acyl-carrier-protein] synthase III